MSTFTMRTQLSGYGFSGICTFVSREVYSEALKIMPNLRHMKGEQPWEKLTNDVDPWGRTGIDESLHRLQDLEDDNFICLGWNHHKRSQCLKSIGRLTTIVHSMESIEVFTQKKRMDCFELEIASLGYRNGSGWHVQANFGMQVWDVIESPGFENLIVQEINPQIQKWWEEEYSNVKKRGQYTTIYDGCNGLVLQVYHPDGNGLWIVGDRASHYVNQFSDHNTDGASQAWAHIYSLCVILEACRKHAGTL